MYVALEKVKLLWIKAACNHKSHWSGGHPMQKPKTRRWHHCIKLLLPALLLCSFSAAAHNFWIEPSRYRFAPEEPLLLTLREGPGFKGNSIPYIDALVQFFRIYDASREQPVETGMGDDPAARIVHTGTKGLAVAYLSRGLFVELDPRKFRDYLLEESMDYVIPILNARGLGEERSREFYVRCAKTLIRDEEGSTREVFNHRFRMPLEIIPERDPYAPDAGDELPVLVLFNGKPIDGVGVTALLKGADRTPVVVRTRNGRASVKLNAPGDWLIKTVHMVEYDPAKADWISYWATLTIRR